MQSPFRQPVDTLRFGELELAEQNDQGRTKYVYPLGDDHILAVALAGQEEEFKVAALSMANIPQLSHPDFGSLVPHLISTGLYDGKPSYVATFVEGERGDDEVKLASYGIVPTLDYIFSSMWILSELERRGLLVNDTSALNWGFDYNEDTDHLHAKLFEVSTVDLDVLLDSLPYGDYAKHEWIQKRIQLALHVATAAAKRVLNELLPLPDEKKELLEHDWEGIGTKGDWEQVEILLDRLTNFRSDKETYKSAYENIVRVWNDRIYPEMNIAQQGKEVLYSTV